MSSAARGLASVAVEQPQALGLEGAARDAADAACRHLLNRQSPQGFWAGDLEGDVTLEADYVLLQLWLHQPDTSGTWAPPSRARIDAACRRISDNQLADGGWSIFHSGPANVSASVKAYCALKLGGTDPGDDRMQRAAARILSLGGVEAANSYTKLYLSYFGLYPRGKVPSIPPEIFLLPPEHRFSVYAMSSWSRAMLAPLSILDVTKARRRVPAGFGLGELASGRDAPRDEWLNWKRFFLLVDRSIKLLESADALGNRQRGLEAAKRWMLDRLEGSDGLGAIFPAMLNAIMALTQLGYGRDHPLLRREIEHFESLVVDNGQEFRVQPCHSPVWDTALAMFAIGSALPDPSETTRWALGRAADWLLTKQTLRRGDWAVRNPGARPGAWYFEFANEHYPDTDDTAKALLALERVQSGDPERQSQAERRASDWLAAMQSSDGGWAAFDVDSNDEILAQVPFADHNAMLDPTCADITGRVLEALCRRAPSGSAEAIRSGVAYLLRTQEQDGCWPGRWGVNYLYGTCFALRGLRAAGVPPRDAAVIRAGEWVRSIQNPDGGWGESPESYEDPPRPVTGPSTPSQTAWALMALFASDDYESGSVIEGVRYLVERQDETGAWQEEAFTGTGFPRVFYLRYHMYALCFPLMALGEYLHREGRTGR